MTPYLPVADADLVRATAVMVRDGRRAWANRHRIPHGPSPTAAQTMATQSVTRVLERGTLLSAIYAAAGGHILLRSGDGKVVGLDVPPLVERVRVWAALQKD
ncbi:MAG: hypothetical protein K6U87_07160 [Firmicutes bacterium]|nr:hypothetical protein [Bacillota bacterium]